MQFAKIPKALVGVAVLALASTVAFADVTNKKTTLTVKETIEVPGATLPPGEYVVRLVDSQANRHIVRFLNEDENEVISTVIALPNSRMEPTGETEFAWHETPAGQPPALKAWFYPGDTYGQEFAYPESRARELSAATNQEVPHVSDQEMQSAANQPRVEIAQAQAPQTQNTQREAAAQQDRDAAAQQNREDAAAQQNRDATAQQSTAAQQRERDLQAQRDRERQAQTARDQEQQADPNLTAQQQTQQTTSTGNELPATAGLGMLLALIGLGSLGASRVVRKMRK